jgi:uncharacterized membrane protein
MACSARIWVGLFLASVSSLGCGDKQNPLGASETLPCDTVSVSYSGKIAPMMAKSCTVAGCHGGPTPAAAIALDSYDAVKANASTSNAEIQAKKMPIGAGAALTDSDRRDFAIWAGCGTLNN